MYLKNISLEYFFPCKTEDAASSNRRSGQSPKRRAINRQTTAVCEWRNRDAESLQICEETAIRLAAESNLA